MDVVPDLGRSADAHAVRPAAPSAVLELQPLALRPLRLGSLRPAGWLRQQLQLQVDGAAGHLDEHWSDVRDSKWIGGSGDGWERGPYWLGGVVPLAATTGDPRLSAKVQAWVDHLIATQTADGWLGPHEGDPGHGHNPAYGPVDVWPRMVVLDALLQWYDATGDERILSTAARALERLHSELLTHPLYEWGRVRWADLASVAQRLAEATGDDALLAVADLAREQGYPWAEPTWVMPHREKVTEEGLKRFEAASGEWMNDDFLSSHGVNAAMGLRALPVRWRQNGDEEVRRAFTRLLADLDRHHGQATGLFSADEHLAGREPSQGTETCTVVEFMASLEAALATWGFDEQLVDRLERLAYNALPACATADDTAHQYVQQANQVICHVTEDRVYTNNGPDANTFGLEPHFGCCTANRHQGWPRFAARLWQQAPDGALVALSYAPCAFEAATGTGTAAVQVAGGYPFDEEVRLTVLVSGHPDGTDEVRVRLRVPAWADQPSVAVDGGSAQALAPDTVHEVSLGPGEHHLLLHIPAQPQVLPGGTGGVVVALGPLLLPLAVQEDWREVGDGPHPSYEVHPASAWNYALALDPQDPTRGLQVQRRALKGPPFRPEAAPVRVDASGVRLPAWQLEHGAAAPLPPSPVMTGDEAEPVTLLPYGAARLRVTELPWTARPYGGPTR